MYKLKQIPNDFIVTELNNFKLKQFGKYLIIKLTKTSRTTNEAISSLAKFLKIKENKIGYAGLKDKNAITEQYISIEGKSIDQLNKIKLDNIKLEPLGYFDKPISLGDLKGNKFKITIRNLENFKVKKLNYTINYFDEQRFSEKNCQIGKNLIKKQFNKVANLIDHKSVKNYLEKEPTNYIGAIRTLPIRLLRLYVNSYQSYLWNTLVSKLVKKEKSVKYSLGNFIFGEIEDISVPLIGFLTYEYNENKIIKKLIEDLLKEEKITYDDFIIKQIPELSLEGDLRLVRSNISNLKISKEELDEINANKKKITISFSLNKGSYATIVIKNIISTF